MYPMEDQLNNYDTAKKKKKKQTLSQHNTIFCL